MSTTRLTGLIGYPVAHSLSPHIHAYWAKEYDVDTEYKLFTTAPARLRQTMLHMRKKNVAGVNITVPHKVAVMEYLDAVDVAATRIGAVNTVINQNGVFTGTNTDAYGFITNLREGINGSGSGDINAALQHVVLLGAGGATRAAIVALQQAGARAITLINRSAEKAQKLADVFSVQTLPWEVRNEALSDATLLVNTTSLGMHEKPTLELDLTLLPGRAVVHDIVYAPLQTELLRNAAAKGHPVVDGLGMLLYQAQGAFHAWHGVMPDVTPALRAQVIAMKEAAETP